MNIFFHIVRILIFFPVILKRLYRTMEVNQTKDMRLDRSKCSFFLLLELDIPLLVLDRYLIQTLIDNWKSFIYKFKSSICIPSTLTLRWPCCGQNIQCTHDLLLLLFHFLFDELKMIEQKIPSLLHTTKLDVVDVSFMVIPSRLV